MRLARVGYDNSLGYLKGGFDSWINAGYEVDKIKSISAEEFKTKFETKSMEMPLDVRKESEFQSEHVIGIENFPLDLINQNFAEINPDKAYFLHCAGGYRSLISSSVFKRNGVRNVTDVRGGFKAIKETGIALTEYVCPTTLL